MEPKKKKDFIDYAIPVIGIIVALIVLLQAAVAYDTVKYPVYDDNGNIEKYSFDLIAFSDEFVNRIEKAPTSILWTESSLTFLMAGIFVGIIAVMYYSVTKKNYITNKEYGTSTWGTAKQIAHLRAKKIKNNAIKEIRKMNLPVKEKYKRIKFTEAKYTDETEIILTETEKVCMYNYELNNNVMIIGGSGSGKTRGYVLPNILQCCNSPFSPSLVITDPKGEILGKVGKYLEKQGYAIKVLNLKEQARSFCFNPFNYIIEDNYEEQISSIVTTIMESQGSKEQKPNDPFWEKMAGVLLQAIFYAVYETYEDKDCNMTSVMEMFRWFEVSDHDDRYKNPTKLDRYFEIIGDTNGTLKVAESIMEFSLFYLNSFGDFEKKLLKLFQMKLDKKDIQNDIKIDIGSSDSSGIKYYRENISAILEGLEEFSNNAPEDERQAMLQQQFNMLYTTVLPQLETYAYEAMDLIDKYIQDRYDNYAPKYIKVNGENQLDVTRKKPIGVELFEKYGGINDNPALRKWEDFRTKCKGKPAQSVTATLLSKLAPFDEQNVKRIFSRDEMELDLVGERKTALFVVLPPTNRNYDFIGNVLYSTLFRQLEYCATVKHNQSLPVPVRFILDEFYNTGKIDNFPNMLSYARSFGIGISIILQSLEQIKEMYEKSWGTLVDNCSSFLYLGGVRHEETLEYISKLIGKGTFDKKTYSRSRGKQSGSSVSNDKIGRDLLDPAEVGRISKKKCILHITGYQPYMSLKFNYKKHKNYKYTSDYNRKNHYAYKLPEEIEEENKLKNMVVNLGDEKVALTKSTKVFPQQQEKQKSPDFKSDNKVENAKSVMDIKDEKVEITYPYADKNLDEFEAAIMQMQTAMTEKEVSEYTQKDLEDEFNALLKESEKEQQETKNKNYSIMQLFTNEEKAELLNVDDSTEKVNEIIDNQLENQEKVTITVESTKEISEEEANKILSEEIWEDDEEESEFESELDEIMEMSNFIVADMIENDFLSEDVNSMELENGVIKQENDADADEEND